MTTSGHTEAWQTLHDAVPRAVEIVREMAANGDAEAIAIAEEYGLIDPDVTRSPMEPPST